ncbi:SIS domain-containing protein [Deinococcus sp. Arct2-2]|uniref:SIS domain-containing protein n=1 Tax=Deinococcus sp. Arct2-2 TaxID=2568653 RepID=UPI0010A31737|nr:SIS domain-containing protein [Deinococcus sp. Arct2-2]THF70217.1 SIS domain-containing protein [Deinococcus sp. Arct2-2]
MSGPATSNPASPELTSFELDMLEQPAALRRALELRVPPELAHLVNRPWNRVVFTGMGSSHYAALPTWRSAVAAGLPAWHLDAGQLLDSPDLLTDQTLIIATSQSGASGEIVELIERQRGKWGALIGVTDIGHSPLAAAADLFLPLGSGPEATVSTKSYLNTLFVHRHIAAAIAREDRAEVEQELHGVADLVGPLLSPLELGELDLSALARGVLEQAGYRLVSIGKGDDAATALYASLIIKEAAKVAVEGYIGGQFRHGPMELAGAGLTALVFGARRTAPDEGLRRLAQDITATGSHAVLIGDDRLEGASTTEVPCGTAFASLVSGALVAQHLAVQLACANGVIPGAFIYGSKVTSTL